MIPATAWPPSRKALEWGDRIPLGIIYQTELPTYEEQVFRAEGGPGGHPQAAKALRG